MATIQGDATTVNEAGVKGTNTAKDGRGVYGESKKGTGVWGWSKELSGVVGDSVKQYGVLGTTKAAYHGGVTGINNNRSEKAGPGVYGTSKGTGIWGESETWMGVYGHSKSTTGGAGVMGEIEAGAGVIGKSGTWHGVYGHTDGKKGNIGNAAVAGEAEVGNGIFGTSKDGCGVVGHSHSQNFAAVFGENLANGDGVFGSGGETGRGVVGISKNKTGVLGISETETGVFGTSKNGRAIWGSGKIAGYFEGDVEVTGDIRLINADFAEDFEVLEMTEPGEVMVLTENGSLAPSTKAYDKKVVGVLSGAGKYKPGIILDNQGKKENRKPVAMMGKVYCKVDADTIPIEVGDLLTTSYTPGFAMKATDPYKSFGAIIGKALGRIKTGKGLIPILVTLQ